MTRKRFRSLVAGTRVRSCGLTGTVMSAGINSLGHYYVVVDWDGLEEGCPWCSSFYTDEDRLLRKFHSEE